MPTVITRPARNHIGENEQTQRAIKAVKQKAIKPLKDCPVFTLQIDAIKIVYITI